MAKVIVTGGCGYIGSHTLVELIAAGHTPVSIDDNSRSREDSLAGVERITGQRVRNYKVDLRDVQRTEAVFSDNRDAVAVIHFAAYKTVPESVAKPLLYYDNNLNSLLNVLACADRYHIPRFIFSSSCAVYGNVRELPVTEETPFGEAECPYARTKQMGEDIIRDFAKASETIFVSLRYFNPVGAHPSGEIGETPFGEPDNLVPRITRTAAGLLPELVVHGTDYDTRDGTCIRDYVHVSDIARAHVLAIEYLARGMEPPMNADGRGYGAESGGRGMEPPMNAGGRGLGMARKDSRIPGFEGSSVPAVESLNPGLLDPAAFSRAPGANRRVSAAAGGFAEVFNLGSGTGTTVLEAIGAFEKATARKLNYRVGPRRPGDTAAVYSDNRKAESLLGWRPERGVDEMMKTAWQWELALSAARGNSPADSAEHTG